MKFNFKNNQSSIINHQSEGGFTLMELIVAIGVFSIVVGINTNMFINAIQAQRKALVVQNIVDNTRYVMEVISKELRVAQTGLSNSFTTNIYLPINVSAYCNDGSYISFISHSENRIGYRVGFCLSEAGDILFDDDLTDATLGVQITSGENVKVTSLSFIVNSVSGQPKITIALSAQAKNPGAAANTTINLQTTISPREINL